MSGKCYMYGPWTSLCEVAAAEERDQAPDTFTGPKVKSPPRKTPATASTSTETPRNEPRTRGGSTRKMRGGVETSATTSTIAAKSSTLAHVSTSTTPKEKVPAKEVRGCRSSVGGRGASTAPVEPASTTVAFQRGVATSNASTSSAVIGGSIRKRRGGVATSATISTTAAPYSAATASTSTTPTEQLPAKARRGERSSRGGRGAATAPVEPASATVVFRKGVATSSPRTSSAAIGGRPRGRGSRAKGRARVVHRSLQEISENCVGITKAQVQPLPREPTLAQVLNTGRSFGRVGGKGGGRMGGLLARGGRTFSSTSGRGNRRFMDWLGTPEQWANDENQMRQACTRGGSKSSSTSGRGSRRLMDK